MQPARVPPPPSGGKFSKQLGYTFKNRFLNHLEIVDLRLDVPVCDKTIVAESGGGVYVIFDSPCQTWKTSYVEQLIIQFTL
jgi:hypothetical protein